MRTLVATRDRVFRLVPGEAGLRPTTDGGARPTCLASDRAAGRAWCGTTDGVLRSDDGGESWLGAGLEGEEVTALAPDPAEPGAAWAGTEPSAIYRSADGGRSWERVAAFGSTPAWLRGLALVAAG